jgi:hypothetical protein
MGMGIAHSFIDKIDITYAQDYIIFHGNVQLSQIRCIESQIKSGLIEIDDG